MASEVNTKNNNFNNFNNKIMAIWKFSKQSDTYIFE